MAGTQVKAPDGTTIEFPDSMKDQDIEAAMAKLYPPPAANKPSVLGTAGKILASPVTALASIPGKLMDWAKGGFTPPGRFQGTDKQGFANGSLPMGFDEPVTQGYGDALAAMAPPAESLRSPVTLGPRLF